jgi:hypothetical protein
LNWPYTGVMGYCALQKSNNPLPPIYTVARHFSTPSLFIARS